MIGLNKDLVTVIIPIYNVEKYLDRCITSIVNQTYRNLEILLIDDGSPDNCPKICDDWAKKDERVRVIHKQNEGLGFARNTGIENASGKFICFFDSDDYIDLNTIEQSVFLAKSSNADVVIFGLNTVDKNNNVIQSFITCSNPNIFSGDEVINNFLPEYIAPDPHGDGSRKFYMSSCVSLYSLKMIRDNNFRFVSERKIISEDIYSLIELFSYVKKVAILPEAYYYYCENETSLSHTKRSDRYEKIKYFYLECIKLCKSLGYSDEILKRVSKPYLAYTISALKQECAVFKDKKELKREIKKIFNDDVLQTVLKQNKGDKVSFTRKTLFFTIRNKMYNTGIRLLKLKA